VSDVVSRDGSHEKLDRASHRQSEPLGDLCFGVGGASEERFEGLVGLHGEEPTGAEQRDESGLQDAFVSEVADPPPARGGGRATRRPHEHPLVVVGHQRERHAALTTPSLGALHWTGRPRVAGDGDVGAPIESGAVRPIEHGETNEIGVVDVEQGLIGAEVDAVLGGTDE
jgi:hypothetical protein